MTTTSNEHLKTIVEKVGKDLIWRPVHDFQKNKLVDGIGHNIDGIDSEFKDLSFKNKTVCDLGCNLGYYSFYALEHGAEKVTGYDIEPKLIAGANKIADLNNLNSITFKVCDFANEEPDETYDMGMLIDIIGKHRIRSGGLLPMLAGLEKRSKSEMLLTFRPEYSIHKHFGMDATAFKKIYPNAVIENNNFNLFKFVCNFFAPKWELAYCSNHADMSKQYKYTSFFIKKS